MPASRLTRSRVRFAALARSSRAASSTRLPYNVSLALPVPADKFRRDTESFLVTHPLRHHSRAIY
jgi:hypothetical protein